MKNFAVAMILAFSLLASAVPALAQEPAPLPEIKELYFPVVARPCEVITQWGAENCIARQYCRAFYVGGIQVDTSIEGRIVDHLLFYRGEEVPHSLQYNPFYRGGLLVQSYLVWFRVPYPPIYGSEMQIVLFLDNGCKLDATTELTYRVPGDW